MQTPSLLQNPNSNVLANSLHTNTIAEPAYCIQRQPDALHIMGDPLHNQPVQPVVGSGTVFDNQFQNGNGLAEAGANMVVPGLEITENGVGSGVGLIGRGLDSGVKSIEAGLRDGLGTAGAGFGMSNNGSIGTRDNVYHRKHGFGTGLAEVGSGVVGTAVGLAGTAIGTAGKLGGMAIGAGLAIGGGAIGIGADLIGTTVGTLGNGVRTVGRGFADMAHKKH